MGKDQASAVNVAVIVLMLFVGALLAFGMSADMRITEQQICGRDCNSDTECYMECMSTHMPGE